MKRVERDELYENLRGFLKSKGIALDSGAYAQRIHQGCNLLADAINATQKTVARAKAEADKKLDQLRQSIHEATAPKSPGPRPSTTGKSAQAKGKPRRRQSARGNAKNSDASPSPEPTS
jgi:hypothetical protein